MKQIIAHQHSLARSLRMISTALILVFSLTFLGVTPVLAAPSDVALSVAPINPGFLIAMQAGQGKQPQIADNGHVLGYIPSPWQRPDKSKSTALSSDATPLEAPLAASSADAIFDLRSIGVDGVTAVRDQGSSGSCWSFATYASLESFLKYKANTTTDFSENNLKNTHGFDWGPNSGGNADISTAYLARWSGPVSEEDDPYDPTSTSSDPGLPVQGHVQEVTYLPDDSNLINRIKQAIIDGGATYTAFYYSSTYYNSTNYSYNCLLAKSANHAVAIVGWDDNYPSTNFNAKPAGNGAFIIKNSWGTSWGDGGYFYLSYYDESMTENVAFHNVEALTNYDNNYGYDPLGATTYFGYGTNTAWGANIFTSKGNETLEAVSFYTPVSGSSYEIKVYTDPAVNNPTSGTYRTSQTGSVSDAGYHTVALTLTSQVALTTGQRYSIVMKLTTPGYTYPMAIEYPFAGYSSAATASAGQSFISSNGSTWTDIVKSYRNTNVCLKAFTSGGVVTAEPDLTITALTAPTKGVLGKTIPISRTVQNIGDAPAAACTIQYYLSKDGTIGAGDISLGSKSVLSLAAGASQTANDSVTIPRTTPIGNYYIIGLVDAGGTVIESDEANNDKLAGAITISKK